MKLEGLITKSGLYIQIFMWAHIPFYMILGYLWDQNSLAIPMFLTGICALSTFVYVKNPTGLPTAVLTSTSLALTICVLIYMMMGHEWQPDVHMYLFSGLAICALFCSWQAIIAFTGVVAVHHLALNYLFAAAVFAGGADLARVLLHAVILVVEAGALVFLTLMLRQIFAKSEIAVQQAGQARVKAESLMQEADLKQETLSNGIQKLRENLTRLARGDLTTRVDDDSFDRATEEFRVLYADMNALADNLHSIFDSVTNTAQMVLAASNETSSAASDIAHKAESQANTVNQSAQVLAELSASQTQTAERAKHARSAMNSSRHQAEKGGELLRKAVDAMQQIEISAGAIRQSIDAIDDIAFQTNLLALNAGVEAARAGDSASGFAVVASEVRNLAQRASVSAADIRRLMTESDHFVTSGSKIVNSTADTLSDLIAEAAKSGELIETIAAHSQEQAENLRRLNEGMQKLESSAQSFAGSAEQTTATSISLREQAAELSHTLSQFKTRPQMSKSTLDDWDDAIAAQRRFAS
jgi:methyl-accepting chemotaxis protein